MGYFDSYKAKGNRQPKSCKRKKCPYYGMVTSKCSSCEWNPDVLWKNHKHWSRN